MRHYLIMSFATCAALCAPLRAQAQTCNTNSTCVQITQNGTGNGLFSMANGAGAVAVTGECSATIGPGFGVYGETRSSSGYGIFGNNASTGGGVGVYGTATSGISIYGYANSVGSIGVEGSNAATTGAGEGVVGGSASASGYGVYGTNTSTGTAGSSGAGSGVFGTTTVVSGAGVYGTASATSSNGVYGVATGPAPWGVVGTAVSGSGGGVQGLANNGGTGVYGTSDSGDGVFAGSTSGWGVYGTTTSGQSAVRGVPTNGAYSNGVWGSSSNSGASGVYGDNSSHGYGVAGRVSPSGAGDAIYGDNDSTTGYAGWFNGWVNITRCAFINNTAYGGCNSDARLKKNVEPLVGSLDKIAALRPVSYEWRKTDDHHPSGAHIGFIAQDVEKVFPEWVGTDDDGFKTVDRGGLDVFLVDAVQALKRKNDDLKVDNDDLRQRVKALEAGRRPLVSGFGEGGIGVGLLAIACAVAITRRKPSGEHP